jgi:hypothetical protein
MEAAEMNVNELHLVSAKIPIRTDGQVFLGNS